MEFNATFIVAAISFIVFSIMMNWIFYKPIQKIVEERQKFIDDTYKEAKSHQKESEAILKDKERKLGKTKQDAKLHILEKSNEVKSKKAALTSEAQQKANNEIEIAKNELLDSKNKAKDILSDNVVNLAEDISSKILGESVSINNVDKDIVNRAMEGNK